MIKSTDLEIYMQQVSDNFSCPDLKIELLDFTGLAPTLMALRMPYKKEVRSLINSVTSMRKTEKPDDPFAQITTRISGSYCIDLARKDIDLLSTLVARGDEHAKCIRGINVYLSIAAPMYFWKQMDTYRFGTERLASESTMHVDCRGLSDEELEAAQKSVSGGYIQTRIQSFSYQTLRRIYFQRKDDRLRIWRDFCEYIKQLPFAAEWITIQKQ